MKICFIALKAYPVFNPKVKSNFGGSEVQLGLFALELAKKQDNKVYFLVFDHGQDNKETVGGVIVQKVSRNTDNILIQAIKMAKILINVHADVYITRSLNYYVPLVGLISRLLGKKNIYMVASDKELDNTHYINNKMFGNFFVNLSFWLANSIVVQNEYQKKIFGQNFPNKKILLINSGYEIGDFKNQQGRYIFWVGRSENIKRPELFLKLAKAVPNEKFIIICPPSKYNPKLSEKIRLEAQKINNLKFIRFVPFNKIDKYFLQAKIFVNTSTMEGFPNTFIQAAKNGVPIISLDVNPNNFITKYKCGYHCAGDFNKMVRYINFLSRNEKLYRELSLNAYNYAKENHDISKNAQIFKNFIM